MPDGSATSHLYCPKLVTSLREGYGLEAFRADCLAGLTVAIVALPLSMAIAVASGVSPDRGLYAAIVGGVLVSALGGSRYQIGGPAGAFIVLVAAAVAQFGLEGLLLTVAIAGLLLILVGILGLGSLIRHIPHAVTVGFTGGIAMTIFASQLSALGGLKLAEAEPGPLLDKMVALMRAYSSLNVSACVIGIGSAALIFLIKRQRPAWPGMLIAITVASAAAAILHLPVETVRSRFGELPHGLSLPHLPSLSIRLLIQIFPTAMSFALLGGVESLLSAKVADGMTQRRHRSNMELVAQGIANVASACFGGISVTGTIARTATNVRAGARSPIAGIMHSVFLFAFLLIAAPAAGLIPLSALAGVLIVVCWNMAEKHEFSRLLKRWPSAVILLTTFLLTLFANLTAGIVAGCIVAAILAAFGQRTPAEEN